MLSVSHAWAWPVKPCSSRSGVRPSPPQSSRRRRRPLTVRSRSIGRSRFMGWPPLEQDGPRAHRTPGAPHTIPLAYSAPHRAVRTYQEERVSSIEVPDSWGLEGKVAIVLAGCAAGDGIGDGRASAILVALAGARVVVVDQTLALADRTVAMIKSQGGEALAVAADITKSRDCAGMVEAARDRFGRLDFLDNNVGIGSRGSVVDETEENWRRVMQVNVETMFLAAKHAIPAMIKAGGGAIVNVSSISALRPRGLTVYSASKGAVIALTRAMAVDHGKDGIRVNCVAP